MSLSVLPSFIGVHVPSAIETSTGRHDAGVKGHAGRTRRAHQAAGARCKACAEEAAKGDSECSEDASNVHSKIWSLH